MTQPEKSALQPLFEKVPECECGGRLFVNGHCAYCDHEGGNAVTHQNNRIERGISLFDHAMLSIEQGFSEVQNG